MTGFKLVNLTVFEVELPEGLHSTPSPLAQASQVKVGIHAPATSYVALHIVVRLKRKRKITNWDPDARRCAERGTL